VIEGTLIHPTIMNSITRAALVLAAAATLPSGAAEPVKRVVMREAPTHDQIVEFARKAKEENPMPVFTPAAGEDPSKVNRLGDLISRSDILCFQGRATLVPKRAVLHVPKSLSGRLGMQEGSQIESWTEFLNANRGWIRTVAVTRIQAEGNDPMPEAVLKSFVKEQRVVIATYQEGPISVLPLKVPETPVAGEPGAKVAAPVQAINVATP
jgi:hypothetical protein